MNETERKEATLTTEALIALVYAGLVVGCTVFFQMAV